MCCSCDRRIASMVSCSSRVRRRSFSICSTSFSTVQPESPRCILGGLGDRSKVIGDVGPAAAEPDHTEGRRGASRVLSEADRFCIRGGVLRTRLFSGSTFFSFALLLSTVPMGTSPVTANCSAGGMVVDPPERCATMSTSELTVAGIMTLDRLLLFKFSSVRQRWTQAVPKTDCGCCRCDGCTATRLLEPHQNV